MREGNSRRSTKNKKRLEFEEPGCLWGWHVVRTSSGVRWCLGKGLREDSSRLDEQIWKSETPSSQMRCSSPPPQPLQNEWWSNPCRMRNRKTRGAPEIPDLGLPAKQETGVRRSLLDHCEVASSSISMRRPSEPTPALPRHHLHHPRVSTHSSFRSASASELGNND